jgi:hypothetical protein
MWIIGLYRFDQSCLGGDLNGEMSETKTQLHICDRLDNPVHVKRIMAAKMWRVCKGR